MEKNGEREEKVRERTKKWEKVKIDKEKYDGESKKQEG